MCARAGSEATCMACVQVSTGHVACIHDIAHDYYGRRLATCSSDKVKHAYCTEMLAERIPQSVQRQDPERGSKSPGHHIPIAYFILTCPDSQTIRIFDKDDNDEWKLTCQWPAHKSVIWRVRIMRCTRPNVPCRTNSCHVCHFRTPFSIGNSPFVLVGLARRLSGPIQNSDRFLHHVQMIAR